MQQNDLKSRILIFCDYYLPGYKSGGALRTLANMVDRLGDRYDFRVVTRDHDGRLDRKQYTSVRIDAWNRVGKADVYYISKVNLRPKTIKKLVEDVNPQAIYLNSFFATLTVFVLLLRKFGRVLPLPVVVAPEGEFSPGAMSIKPFQKKLYLAFAKAFGLHGDIIWKAASEHERNDIKAFIGKNTEVLVAPNMPPGIIFPEYSRSLRPAKSPGEARMAFLSRFTRMKNFNWLLPHISTIQGELVIDIYGPLEDVDYWEECKTLIAGLPDNIKVEAKGPIPHEEVVKTLVNYHFFILPTLGENFGHIFLEALAAGCPLITSDATPWRGLPSKGIGWDLSLDDPDEWIKVLNQCIAINQQDYERLSLRAREFVVEWLADRTHEEANERVLESSLSAGR